MDRHNRQYHLIFGEQNWLPLLLQQDSARLWWDQNRQIVTLAPIVPQVNALTQQEPLNQQQRRGAAFDHYGNVYWISDDNQSILFHPATTPLDNGEFWHIRELQTTASKDRRHGDFTAQQTYVEMEYPQLSGLTITTCEYLVVGTLASPNLSAGLLIFDLHAGGAPLWLAWPEYIQFTPMDMSCTPDGGLFILDSAPEGARVWHLDKHFCVLDCNGDAIELSGNDSDNSNDFHNQDISIETVVKRPDFYSGLNLAFISANTVEAAVAIEAVAVNAFIILDESPATNYSTVHYFRNSALVDTVELNAQAIGSLLNVDGIAAHDFAYLPTQNNSERIHRGLLYISASRFYQAFEFIFYGSEDQLQLAMQPKLLPMRALTGRALISSGKGAWYDFEDRWLPLAEQPLKQFQSEAVLEDIVLDGEEPDCVWHRLIMDGRIPPGTSVQFSSRAANSQTELKNLPWQTEPPLYKRAQGSELALPMEPLCLDEYAGSFEYLFQQAQGRYLELRMHLTGTRQKTPWLQSLRVYYPRFSWLQRYLPAVYQEDERSAKFLDRFLANVEGIYTQLEDKIAHAETLFDTRTAPPEFLEWLGQWLGAFVDPVWSEQRKRLFIDNAILLFNWRGTPACLKALIRLSIDECPSDDIFTALRSPGRSDDSLFSGRNVRISEHFLTRRIAHTETESVSTSLALTGSNQKWQPSQGAGVLHQLYQRFLRYRYNDDLAALTSAWSSNAEITASYQSFADIQFPPLRPVQAAHATNWSEFTRDYIGFTYAEVNASDLQLYQAFLSARYKQVKKLNSAHGLVGGFALADFSAVRMPTKIPQHQTALIDWIEFVSLSLPIQRESHQFTVFLPTVLGELPAALEARRAQVEAIVEREKPAHTQFDVKFFWLMFQVGSARLGIDTSIGEGARFVAMVLGANFLGQSYLAESHPWSIADRSIVGRERITYELKWRP